MSTFGKPLSLRVPHDVFSTQRIDEGTVLLLENLAVGQPKSILDMGCGYGALGLPIAAKYPAAVFEMVDRDLLAVSFSGLNAANNALSNVRAYGSLGFRDVIRDRYDWILCNVPARIGRPFIQNLIHGGCARLSAGGDLRVVVINDLCPILQELAVELRWPMTEVKRAPRHTVYAFTANNNETNVIEPDSRDLYFRDEVEFGGMKFARPFDLGGDDPKRLKQGLPVLFDALPRDPKAKFKNILCFRIGYGILPLYCRQKWGAARVVAVDRDLLATTFTRINSQALNLSGDLLQVRENHHFPAAIETGETFDLIAGELSPSAGERIVAAELEAISEALTPGGQAYLLCLNKVEKDWVMPFATKKKITVTAILKRDGYSALRIFRA
ncbi:MAG: methyltransferase [Bdellovibrionales bacterium]|nr:methyltransferase [Bdellovibrionales bacterium]